MMRIVLVKLILLLSLFVSAQKVIVKNADELNKAVKNAKPGSVIILRNGDWKDLSLSIGSKGTKEKPILVKAETAGKVIIKGKSRLALGGEFVTIDGLVFQAGYSGEDAVIEYRMNKDQVANNCRVTNCVIDNFNNPERLDENYWVAFYGKQNRLDHCSFMNKKNLGVLLAVILDDERSRENFHSIDHNYFGKRIPLASNGGEIIRVGVSQHCQFNSNTQITDNLFEHCDGETEIVSIKSGSNLVKNNVFRECQGGVVLRHGDYNTVENNIFLGNDKEGTGGVRIINKGQWVVNNFFYKCRGVDFRSPLSIMNGIPNSPANRYVQVTDAVIANNTFIDCSAISLCEGSDAERTLPPANVLMINNIFYNSRDTVLVKVFDKLDGFRFSGNETNMLGRPNHTATGPVFERAMIMVKKEGNIEYPGTQIKGAVALPDSIRDISQQRIGRIISTRPGFSDLELLQKIQAVATNETGARWYKPKASVTFESVPAVSCKTPAEVIKEVNKKKPAIIKLTAKEYHFTAPLLISSAVEFRGERDSLIRFSSDEIKSLFTIDGNGSLLLHNLSIDGARVRAKHLIASHDGGSSAHYDLMISNCTVSGLKRESGCEDLFYANKSIVADQIVITSSVFQNNKVSLITMNAEKDDKGYYNAENIIFTRNNINNHEGVLIDIYRGGNDESTLGPRLVMRSNTIGNSSTKTPEPFIQLTGVQVSEIYGNTFGNVNPGKTLIKYTDRVRARHNFSSNIISRSGSIDKNQFYTETGNKIE